MTSGVGLGEESFEDLLGRESYFAGYGQGGEVVGVDLVGEQLVGDVERVEEAGGVGFGGCRLHALASGSEARIWPRQRVRVRSAMGSASLARWVVMRMVRLPATPFTGATGQVRKSARSSTMCWEEAASRLEKGSSRRRSSGSVWRTRANEVRWRMP